MLAKVSTSTIHGLSAIPVDVEVRLSGQGKFEFTLIGLGDTAVRESKQRVLSALRSTGFSFPEGHILVNLAPAEIRKEGSSYDLAIAMGILAAAGKVPHAPLRGVSLHGELALDGALKSVRGAVAMSVAAAENGQRALVVPRSNAGEAALVNGVEVLGISHLSELVAFVSNGKKPQSLPLKEQVTAPHVTPKISDVWGQESAKRAMLIAAAGGHNILFIGPPGCGKSMLASRFGTLLPALSIEEQLEVVRIHSIAAQPVTGFLSGQRPYRAPHHLVSDVGLIGGGSVPRPGEISLAHHGVLFLDEFPEFRRSALESLRAPLEAGQVSIARAKGNLTFPAHFQLIAAMNPCPCGRLGVEGAKCLCPLHAVANYLRRLSQPILDRIDLHVELEAVPLAKLGSVETNDSVDINWRKTVAQVREQALRNHGSLNSLLDGKKLIGAVHANSKAQKLLEQASSQLAISARGLVRVLRVARTIADIEAAHEIAAQHIAEALSFRAIDRLNRYAQGIH